MLAALAATLLLAIAATPAAAHSWHPPATLIPGGDMDGSDSVAVSGSTVHLTATRGGVRYRRSTDGGRTFAAERTIVRDVLPAARYTALSIAAYRDVVAILYSRLAPGGVRTLLLRVSIDSGATWARATTIAVGQSQYGRGDGSVAISSSGAFVAWTDPATGRVLLRRNVSAGAGFGPATQVGATTSRNPLNIAVRQGNAAVVASGSRVLVVWSPGFPEATTFPAGVVGVRSTNAGGSFAPQQVIADRPFGVGEGGPVAASMNGAIILVASATTVFRSTNGGASFRAIPVTPRASVVHDVSVGPGGRADVIFESALSLAHRTSADGGSHWANGKFVAGPHQASYFDVNLAVGTATTTAIWRPTLSPGSILVRNNW